MLYDICIQAGRVVNLYIPRDKETDKPKGFAFAEYESEEIAEYAVKLFSGLITLYNRTLRFAVRLPDPHFLFISHLCLQDILLRNLNHVSGSVDIKPGGTTVIVIHTL